MTAAVDVIIPTRNRADLTAEALATVREQTFPDWRVVLIDDAGDDGSGEALRRLTEEDPRISLLRLSVRRGQQGARQAGLDAATAPLVATLDSDDLWEPTKLERQVARFEEARAVLPRLAGVLCWHRWVDERGATVSQGRPRLFGPARPLVGDNMSAPLLDRVAVVAAGGFLPPGVPTLAAASHIEFHVRLTAGRDFAVVPDVLVTCRAHRGPRASDVLGTVIAAESLRWILVRHREHLARYPRDRSTLEARAAARYFAAGDRRRGWRLFRQALSSGGPRAALGVLGRYGPYVIRTMSGVR
jgi:hypothetical protein